MLQNGREIAPSVSWDILLHVKRSGGMSVNELAAVLKMSYMGVKQHCDDLKKRGYVDTWRRPKQTGRPEKIYRPTEKMDVVLPSWGGELCLGLLALVSQAYGETVPERLLYGFLQQKVEQWNGKLKGKNPKERATELAKLRNNDGWICECVLDEHGCLRLVDHHSPLGEVARLFPAVWDLEVRVLNRIFGHTLRRRTNGPHVEFVIEEGTAPPPAPVVIAKTASKSKAKAKVKPVPDSAQEAAPAPEPQHEREPDAEPELAHSQSMETASLEAEALEPDSEPAPEPEWETQASSATEPQFESEADSGVNAAGDVVAEIHSEPDSQTETLYEDDLQADLDEVPAHAEALSVSEEFPETEHDAREEGNLINDAARPEVPAVSIPALETKPARPTKAARAKPVKAQTEHHQDLFEL